MGASIVWPLSLPPLPLEDGYSEAMPDMALRTGTDSGVAKMRPKGAALPWQVDVKLLLTAAQKEALATFYKTTTAGGCLRFQWQRYTNLETSSIDSRFVSPPKFDPVVAGLKWYATFKLEIFP